MIHLRVHTHYSIKRAYGDEKKFISKAKELGMSHLAITDYGGDFGFPYFWQECKKQEIQPIFGIEYFVTNDMYTKGNPNFWDINNGYDTIIFLAKNNEGYTKLLKISSDANQPDVWFNKPRIDYEYISDLDTKGLVCIMPYDFGFIPRALLNSDLRQAKIMVNMLKEKFGNDLYFEVTSNVSETNKLVNKKVINFALENKIEMIASSNVHYPNKEDKEVHDLLLAIGEKKTYAENNLYSLGSNDHYLKNEDSVIQGLHENEVENDLIESLIKNTHEIAAKCTFNLEFPELSIPNPPLPEGFKDNESYFKHLIDEGWKRKIIPRINNGEWDEIKEEDIPKYRERIDYEYDMIKNVFKYKDPNTKNIEGFIPYFLIVSDYTRWAKGIYRRIMQDAPIIEVGPGRGSVGGSIIGYLIDMTTVDAIQFDLTFERFINPERVSWPDVDLDFDPDTAWYVEKYLAATYGEDKVAHILTFQTLAGKMAFQYVSKTLTGNYGKFKDKVKSEFWKSENELKSLYKLDANKAREIQDVIDSQRSLKDQVNPDAVDSDGNSLFNPALYEYYQISSYKKIIDYCISLEGTITSTGSHPGAVIISDRPLWYHTSRVYNGKYPDDSIMLTTSYEKYALEEVNTMKYDLLRLRELTIVKETLKFIEESTGEVIDLNKINPYDIETNLKILKLLKDGDMDGIFQFSSNLFKGLIEKVLSGIEERGDENIAKELFDIIVALEALGRPGPLNSGMADTFASGLANPDNVEKIHPIVDKILEPTYGNMVYQEQIMFILQQLGGFSLGQADMVRRGIASGNAEKIEAQRNPFLEGVERIQLENNPNTTKEELEELLKTANKIFDWMVKFAEYGFNKAHSVEYGMITHRGLYLKANYTVQFMASLMSAKSKKEDKLVKYINVIRGKGIKVLPPKINKSLRGFTVVDGDILFGLEAINGVGEGAVDDIINKYPFNNIIDFIQRTDSRKVGARVLPNLIKAGVFEEDKRFLLKHWKALIDISKLKTKKDEAIINLIQNEGITEENKDKLANMISNNIYEKSLKKRTEKTKKECLDLIDNTEYTDLELLNLEKEVLGMFLSENPLSKFEDIIYAGTVLQKEIKKYTQKDIIKIVGMPVETPPVRRDKNGNEMCFMQLQMIDGIQDCVVFHGPYKKYKNYLIDGKILIIEGKKGRGGGFMVEKVADLEEKEQVFRDFFKRQGLLE